MEETKFFFWIKREPKNLENDILRIKIGFLRKGVWKGNYMGADSFTLIKIDKWWTKSKLIFNSLFRDLTLGNQSNKVI